MNLDPGRPILYLMLLMALAGCAPTLQLQNEASERYFDSPNFEDTALEGNRASGVLILVRTGYIQRDNQEKLSIYLGCDFTEPQSAKLLSANLVDSNGLKLEAADLGMDCPESLRRTASLRGSGYLHFYGDGVPKLALGETVLLHVSIEIQDSVYELSLPLTSKRVWVWPT
ncbi:MULTISPECIES: hypothetical protein [unclassified Thalassolituus]|uniref:hypothetical protein n=1 Tax=unclassified Thalassolituus TaxID=2624967 RepID=UPI0025EF9885|nr:MULTISPECIES: hypothetical protein [unclassified Thalassolituus]|tara:strand:+ start:105 stop:617 length:513 start_codon:yes stop_codon:yes gene_type:complete